MFASTWRASSTGWRQGCRRRVRTRGGRELSTCARKDVATASLAGVQPQLAADTVVIDENRIVLGLVRRGQDSMTEGPSTFRPYVPIREMADYMKEHDLESAPITTSDGKLVGLLYRDDAVREAEGCPDCVRKMI